MSMKPGYTKTKKKCPDCGEGFLFVLIEELTRVKGQFRGILRCKECNGIWNKAIPKKVRARSRKTFMTGLLKK